MENSHIKRSITNLVIALSIATGIFFLQKNYPIFYTRLIAEDNIGENATFIAFSLAAGLMFYFFLKSKIKSQKLACGLIAIGSAFIAGEEISWGQRILRIPVPDILREINVQEEITLHNIDTFADFSFPTAVSYAIFIGIIFSLTLQFCKPQSHKWLLNKGFPFISLPLVPILILVPYYFLVMPVPKSSEIAELILGLVVLLWAVEQIFSMKIISNPTEKRLTVYTIATIVLLTILSAIMSSIYPDRSMETRLNRMAAKDYPERGMFEQADKIFSHIYKYPEKYLKINTRINHAKVLLAQDKKDQAAEISLQALEQPPPKNNNKMVAYHQQRGLAYLILGNKKEAESELLRAIAVDDKRLQNTTISDKRARILYSMAKSYAAFDKHDKAVQYLENAEKEAGSRALKWKIKQWRNKYISG